MDSAGPALFIKKVLEALLSWAFSNRLSSLSGGSFTHCFLGLLSSGSSKTSEKHEWLQNLIFMILVLFRRWETSLLFIILPWLEPVRLWLVDAMLSDDMRLALANAWSTVSDGAAAHCFLWPGSLISKWPPADSVPEVNSHLGFTFC